MVFICIKKRGNGEYYYLRETKRHGKKIIAKDIKYLGKKLSKIDLNKIKKQHPEISKQIEKLEYLDKIKNEKIKSDKYFTDKQSIEINYILSDFKKRYSKINPKDKKKILDNFETKFIFNNSSIEGNKLNFQEVQKLLKQGISPKNKLMEHIYLILNSKNLLDHLNSSKYYLKPGLIEKMHNILLNNVYRTKSYRTNKIKFPNNSLTSMSSENIKFQLKSLLSWYNKNKTKIHPLALIILFHHKFEEIHPFFYGNGEVGRILINYMLSQFNYPPIIIPAKKKQEYFNALNKADKAVRNDFLSTDMRYYNELINFMHKQFVKTYWENFIM